ncbi:MAG: putative toxin-antitoxin system toxin component, PIN family [Candidatus Nanoarchaeia archaeon]|nr:putative toxin-antitoxin system toxin component, PIN family [Candidatus Nanoarchaeia archaeon]
MRVVLDTNVFISGIFWDGNYCSQIIDAWRAGKIMLVSSLEIIEEFLETLRDFKIEMPEEIIREWQNTIIENSVIVVPTEKLDIVKNDPKDNKFFEAAVAGKAQYIVSQDKKHVLNIPEFKGIKTIHPEKFLKLIGL